MNLDDKTFDLMWLLTEMNCMTCRYSEQNNPTLDNFDKRIIKCKTCLEGQCMWSISKKKAEEIIKELFEE